MTLAWASVLSPDRRQRGACPVRVTDTKPALALLSFEPSMRLEGGVLRRYIEMRRYIEILSTCHNRTQRQRDDRQAVSSKEAQTVTTIYKDMGVRLFS
jgi:hypothetical protein